MVAVMTRALLLLATLGLGGCQLIPDIIAFGGHTEPVKNPPTQVQSAEPRK
jgi:hypothetical protein